MEEIKKKAREMLYEEFFAREDGKKPQLHEKSLWNVKLVSLVEKIIDLAVSKERERVTKAVERAMKYTNWSHSVGSHSDDRGGDSDIECTCMEKEIRYKEEAYKNVLNLINTK